jgi:hypothetical protein
VDLASKLYEIRKDRTGSNWYAVFPRANSDVREMYREKYRLHQIDRRFHDFLRDLDAEVDFIPDEWKFDKIGERAREGLIYGGDRGVSKKGGERSALAKKTGAGKAASKKRPAKGAAAKSMTQKQAPARKGSTKKPAAKGRK